MKPATAADRLWPGEHDVADQLPIECPPQVAQRVLQDVPLWFHTFSLDRSAGLYTPGKARDHGYRLASIPATFDGLTVLDVGAFDGFYSFLAEHRGASRVVAVDNEQYKHWVRDRWGVQLAGGEGFATIAQLIGSQVEYRRMEAFDVADLGERFDFIFCFGILHRVENPFGLLRLLTDRLVPGGRMLIETAGVDDDAGTVGAPINVPGPSGINESDHYFYWQFSSASLRHLVAFFGATFEPHISVVVDGQPRLIGHVGAPDDRSDVDASITSR